MDFTAEKKRSSRFWRQVRKETRMSAISRRDNKAWALEDQSHVFEEVRKELVYVDDDEVGGRFALIARKGDNAGQMWVEHGEVKLAGRMSWRDHRSRSLLFRRAIPRSNGKYKSHILSLARYAWWFHYGYDCGAPEHFPHTGGCCLIDDTDPRWLPKENLQTVNDYIEELDRRAIAMEHDAWLELIKDHNFQKALRIVTTLARCKINEYPDPIRDIVSDGVDVHQHIRLDERLDRLWNRHNNRKATYVTSKGEHRAIVAGRRVPAANLLWYMVTGTFLGHSVVYRDGDFTNISIKNLTNRLNTTKDQDKNAKAIVRRRVREIAAKRGL